jgi:hypothetical protein
MKNSFIVSLITIAILSLVSVLNLTTVQQVVAAPCEIKISWLKDNKPISPPVEIAISEYQKYLMVVNIPAGCGNYVRGRYDQGSSIKDKVLFPEEPTNNGPFEKRIPFGEPAKDEYVYRIQTAATNNFTITATNFTEKRVGVRFVDRPGGAPAPVNTGTSTGNSNSSTNSTTNSGGGGTKPSTGVNANIIDPDQVIGRFWNPLDFESVPELITNLIRILFILTGLAAVIVIILAGFRLVIDNGNETQVRKAKDAITWAIVGLIVSILAFSIVAIVQRVIQS